MPNLDRTTLRWLLEVVGFGFLLVACLLHSWGWDAAGIAVLALSLFIEPPASIRAAFLASVLTMAPIQAPYQFPLPLAKSPPQSFTHVRTREDCH